MLKANPRICGTHCRDSTAPKLRAGQNISLVHGAKASGAVFCAGKREGSDALDLFRGVRLGIKGAFQATFYSISALAEVHPAREFTHAFQVESAKTIGSDWRNASQRLKQLDRANVDIEAEALA